MSSDDLIMVTAAEVAERDGVSKQAVTKNVRQLVDRHDIPVERNIRGSIVRFSIADYDYHRRQFGNSEKMKSFPPPADLTELEKAADRAEYSTEAGTSSPSTRTNPVNSNSREEALRQDAWIKLRRSKILMEEDAGNLLRRDKIEEGTKKVSQEIQLLLSRLHNHSDDLALALTRDGEQGVRRHLRKIGFDLATEVSRKLARIAETAPVMDELTIEAGEE